MHAVDSHGIGTMLSSTLLSFDVARELCAVIIAAFICRATSHVYVGCMQVACNNDSLSRGLAYNTLV